MIRLKTIGGSLSFAAAALLIAPTVTLAAASVPAHVADGIPDTGSRPGGNP